MFCQEIFKLISQYEFYFSLAANHRENLGLRESLLLHSLEYLHSDDLLPLLPASPLTPLLGGSLSYRLAR